MFDVSFADFILDNLESNSKGDTGWLFINGNEKLGLILNNWSNSRLFKIIGFLNYQPFLE